MTVFKLPARLIARAAHAAGIPRPLPVKGNGPGRAWEALEDRCMLSSYAVTDLGALGGSSSVAYGVNASGQVVGSSVVSSPSLKSHAFLYSNGKMTDLTPSAGKFNTSARGINAPGEAAGVSSYAGVGSVVYSAVLLTGGKTFTLPPYPGGSSTHSSAYGINSSGQVVGTDGDPFLWTPAVPNGTTGTTIDLGTLGGGGTAFAINPSGQVAGDAITSGGAVHAFLYGSGKMQDLGTLPGGTSSNARGINTAGQVVGYSDSQASPNYHAFLWQNGQMTDLGSLPGFPTSEAFGINASGQVVGTAFPASGAHHAVLYAAGGMQDLNNLIPAGSGWTLLDAFAVSDRGAIVGDGTINGQTHAFLLTPTSTKAGVAFSYTFTALGPYGNVNSPVHPMHVTGLDPSATLPPDDTFPAAEKGVHTFAGLVLRKKGVQTLTITDVRFPMYFGTITLDVV